MNPINKRPDAATRRAQLLDAADLVFAVHGVQAPLELVVDQAGVGRATLYRQFPDRHSIILALMERSAQRLQDRADQLITYDDAFFQLLDHLAERIATSPALSDYWRTVGQSDPSFAEVRQRVWGVFAPTLVRAQNSGLVRQDITPGDISLLSGMLGAGLRGENESQRRALVQRALQIITRGLRPDAAPTLQPPHDPERR